jgi:hypothetical protein
VAIPLSILLKDRPDANIGGEFRVWPQSHELLKAKSSRVERIGLVSRPTIARSTVAESPNSERRGALP